VGGAFILAILLIETGWLKAAHLLPMAAGYAVSATQWLLTAIFAVFYGVRRAFHLDKVRDVGFALVTGRPLRNDVLVYDIYALSCPTPLMEQKLMQTL